MTTELQLIHTVWDIVRAGEKNQDDPINERLMRSFLTIHRGKILQTAFKKGTLIAEECFQAIGQIDFSLTNGEYVSDLLPKIIRFRENAGLMLQKDNLVIPVINSLEFLNASQDKFNKFHPKAKFLNSKLTLYLGQEQTCSQIEDLSDSDLNSTVRKLLGEAVTDVVNIFGLGILVDPDDETGYDWTSSPYPMPDELIETLINSVNAREFGIFLKMRSDEIGDIRHNVAESQTREES